MLSFNGSDALARVFIIRHVGAELLKVPDEVFALRMFVNKAEEIEIALGIANHPGAVSSTETG